MVFKGLALLPWFRGSHHPKRLIRFQKLEKPIFTPTTKAEVGSEPSGSGWRDSLGLSAQMGKRGCLQDNTG